jgi:hypothetical protein
LGMIMFLRPIDFFSSRLCGHFQDHSVMGGSAVRNAMAGSMTDLGIHHNHGPHDHRRILNVKLRVSCALITSLSASLPPALCFGFRRP